MEAAAAAEADADESQCRERAWEKKEQLSQGSFYTRFILYSPKEPHQPSPSISSAQSLLTSGSRIWDGPRNFVTEISM